MRILLAHHDPEILQNWRTNLDTLECITAHDVDELVAAYVANEPHLSFVGGELSFPLATPALVLGKPANVFRVDSLKEIRAVISQKWQPPPPSTFDRATPRISLWDDAWPQLSEKLRTSAVKDEEALFVLLMEGAARNHHKAKTWAKDFTPFYRAVLGEVTYRLPHGSWKALSYLQSTSLRLCSALSLYLPDTRRIPLGTKTLFPSPLGGLSAALGARQTISLR